MAAAIAVVGALALDTGTPARAQTRIMVSVDGAAAGTPLKRVWSYYGYDEANYTTTALGRDLLRTLATINNAPAYIRTHFLLNTGDGTAAPKWGSTNVYTENASGNPVYSWTIMDQIMDAFIAAGTRPMVEIGFMPQALSTRPTPYRNSDTFALDGGCFYPPRDYNRWAALIREWATHSRDRYPGLEDTWLWELWNEPNIDYWQGTEAEFQRLYDYTESALHGVLPRAILGGPSIAGVSNFLRNFLQHCATGTNAVTGTTGTRLDLASFHAKGGVAIVSGHVQMNLRNQLVQHRDGFNMIAAFPQYRSTPIVISEADPDGCAACSTEDVPADAYRNSTAYGAYEVATMKRTLELEARAGVNLMGVLTWAFMFDGEPIFAGHRTLATNGIHKPVLNAFKLLGALGGNRLPVTSSGALTLDQILASSVRGQQPDVDAMATRDGSRVQVLVWNYHDDLVTVAAAPVRVNVTLPAGWGTRATVTHLRVDEAHGDAHTVWLGQGSPATPSAAQRAALVAAMEPAPLEPTRAVDVVGGAVTLDFDLPRFGVSLVTLVPQLPTDAGAPDAPLDAGSPDGGAGGAATGGTSGTGGRGGAGGGGRGGSGGAGGAASGSGGGSGGVPPGSGGASGGGGTTSGSGGGTTSGSGGTTSGSGGTTSGSGGGSGGVPPGSGGASGGGGTPGVASSSSGCGCALDPLATATPGTAEILAVLLLAAGLAAARPRRRRPHPVKARPLAGPKARPQEG
jgi:xylan 1,4-beta-xylosidase